MKKITGLLKRMLCLVLCAMMILGLNTTTYANWDRASDHKKQWKEAVKKAKKKFVLKPTYCTLDDWSGWAEDDPHYMINFDQLMATEYGFFTVSIEADEPVMTRVICREINTVGSGEEYFDLSFDEPVKKFKSDKEFKKYGFDKEFCTSEHSNVYFHVFTTDPDVEVRVTVKGVKHKFSNGSSEKPVKFVIDQWLTK